ncbi:MAG TPA: nucleoside-diphosphate sugar epimerase/dehydratase [Sphaerochaeta sp.]|jgi:FlaA1/EpsC-like NDP-sugar epimerase|nr:nucleoside-diphosphate sugar epimerase/dehydratase [Sphaerochaeta sp.]
MSEVLRFQLFKRLVLIILDVILLLLASAIGAWAVFALHVPALYPTIARLNIIAIIVILIVVRFYRIRISESSLDLLSRVLAGFVPVFFLSALVLGSYLGFRSPWIPYLVVTDAFGFMMILFSRISYRMLLSYRNRQDATNLPRAVVYGAGELGSTLVRQYQRGKLPYRIVGFADDDANLRGSYVLGTRVYGTVKELAQILTDKNAKVLIIAITEIEQERMLAAVDAAKEVGAEVKVIPSLFEIQQGSKELDVRNLDHADLLGRPLITIDREPIEAMVQGKRILVTGAGGSIGSEICRQLLTYGPTQLILVDIDETELHDLSLALHNFQREWSDLIMPVVCDVKNKAKLDRIMETYKPDLIFHAAAYKHVPLQELYPEEAITNNILGSYALLRSAKEHNVKKVVVISTDKAVNPTNVMGATKRVVELLASALTTPETEIIAVRFGNVLGSRGSMLPLFNDQIKAGVPITVTHKDIIRYFMAIPEAVGLVFKAAAMAKGGEVMVLDMGRPVKIYDFAQKLVKYYGDGRSQVIVTGLRPGEKLYEELLADSDTTIPTQDKLVFKAKVNGYSISEEEFVTTYLPVFEHSNDPKEMLATLHHMVPEFTSNGKVMR